MHQRASWSIQQCTCPATAALLSVRVHQSFRRHTTKPVVTRSKQRSLSLLTFEAVTHSHSGFAFCNCLHCYVSLVSHSAGQCRHVVNSVLAPQAIFNTVTLAVMPVYVVMVAFPRKPLVRQAIQLSGPAFGHSFGSTLYAAT